VQAKDSTSSGWQLCESPTDPQCALADLRCEKFVVLI